MSESNIKKQITLISKQANLTYLALAVTIIVCALFTFFINLEISHATKYALIINETGKQRMRSQKIVKNLLIIANKETRYNITNINELKSTLAKFKQIHEALMNSDPAHNFDIYRSEATTTLFHLIDVDVNSVAEPLEKMLKNFDDNKVFNQAEIEVALRTVQRREKLFLEKMNNIVSNYQKQSEGVTNIVYLAIWTFLAIVFVSLIFEYLILFKPLFKEMNLLVQNRFEKEMELDERNAKILKRLDLIKTGEAENQTKEEYAFAVLENREEERVILSEQLEEVLLRKLLITRNHTKNVDTRDLNSMRSSLMKVQENLIGLEKELKRITNNLKPSDIMDFGLISAINKLCNQVNDFTNIEITFTNETFFYARFDHIVEVNLYRMVQECLDMLIIVNGKGEFELILLHDEENLSLEIKSKDQDLIDGEFKKTDNYKKAFQVVKERAKLINATLDYYFKADKIYHIQILFPFGVLH